MIFGKKDKVIRRLMEENGDLKQELIDYLKLKEQYNKTVENNNELRKRLKIECADLEKYPGLGVSVKSGSKIYVLTADELRIFKVNQSGNFLSINVFDESGSKIIEDAPAGYDDPAFNRIFEYIQLRSIFKIFKEHKLLFPASRIIGIRLPEPGEEK